jgi:2-iminobutanoate/2-iminopropanoate deaminase
MTRFANPETMPMPASRYSQIAETVGPGRRLVLSGQIGVTPDGAVCSEYRAQAEQAWQNAIAGL